MLPPTCGACCTCPNVYAPVCGVTYATYGNLCEAQCAGVAVLHDGACQVGEGLDCPFVGVPPCANGQYCRDPCPFCASVHPLRCTQIGACAFDYDCPAGLPQPPCSNGPAKWFCDVTAHKCSYSCP